MIISCFLTHQLMPMMMINQKIRESNQREGKETPKPKRKLMISLRKRLMTMQTSQFYLDVTQRQQSHNPRLKKEALQRQMRTNQKARIKPLLPSKLRRKPLLLTIILRGHKVRRRHNQKRMLQNSKKERRLSRLRRVLM